MANIFRYEADIDKCNQKLMETIAKYAKSGEDVKISDLIACYAYDVLYATTTGQSAGFLDRPVDTKKITSALENWKVLSVLHGSYLRLRPSIYAAIRALWPKANAEGQILDRLDVDHAHKRSAAVQILMAHSDDEHHAQRTTEACIALILAGADPLITSLVTSLFYIYRDPKLLQRLRDEIRRSHIWQPACIKHLMRIKARLPLLNAVLQESLRLQQPKATDFSYVVPEGGVMIGKKHVPGGVSHVIIHACDPNAIPLLLTPFAHYCLCAAGLRNSQLLLPFSLNVTANLQIRHLILTQYTESTTWCLC